MRSERSGKATTLWLHNPRRLFIFKIIVFSSSLQCLRWHHSRAFIRLCSAPSATTKTTYFIHTVVPHKTLRTDSGVWCRCSGPSRGQKPQPQQFAAQTLRELCLQFVSPVRHIVSCWKTAYGKRVQVWILINLSDQNHIDILYIHILYNRL